MLDFSLGLLPGSTRRATSRKTPDREGLLRRLRSIAFACGVGAGVEGLIALAAWGLGFGSYTSLFPGLPPMTFTTALMAVLSAVALCLRVPVGRNGAAAGGLAVAVMVLAVYALAVVAFSVPAFPFPRVSSPQTALSFLFLGGSLLAFEWRTSKGSRPAAGLALMAGSIALVSALGHLFRVSLLFGVPGLHPDVGSSLLTLAAVFALSLGVLAARPDAGIMGTVTSAEPGGSLARPMLRGLLYIGPALGLIALGARRGWFDASFSAAIVAFLGLAWGASSILATARRLNREGEARRRGEERARELFNEASDGIFISDLDGRYTEVNAAACRMFGYAEGELIGRTIMDLIRPEDLPRLLEDREAFLRGDSRVSEWSVRRKDGSPMDIEVSAKILPDGRWQAFARDISERKKAEAALKTAQERLQIFAALVENSSDFIGIADPDGKPLYLNPAGRRMVGLDSDQRLEETRIPEYYAEDQRTFASEVILKEMLETGRWEGETAFRHWRTGDAIPVWDEHFMIRQPETGRILGMGTVTRDLTRRKKDEAALRESERRFRVMADSTPVPLWASDADGTTVLVNAAYERFVGLSEREILDMGWRRLAHPDDLKAYEDAFLSTLRERKPFHAKVRLRRADGAWRWLETFASPRFSERGDFLGYVGTSPDVTERIEAEELLRQERERVDLALRGADLATWDWNIKTGEVIINSRWAEMRGYRPEEIKPSLEFWLSTLHPDDRRMAWKTLEDHFHGRGDYDIELRVQTKSGGWIWTLNRGRIFARDEKGEPVRMAGTELDITERKRAEKSLLSLRETERFRSALEAAASAMVVVGRDGRVVFANGEAEKLFRWKHDEFLGMSVDLLVPERFRPKHASLRDAFFQEGLGKRPMGGSREVFAVRKDGSEFPVEITLTRVEEGGQSLVVASVIDISRRQAAEAALRESEQRFRLLVEGTRDYAIFMHDTQGRITIWNAGAERILGFSGDEIRGGAHIRFYTPEDVARGKPELDLRAAVERGSFEEESWRMRKDGSRFWANVLVTPLAEPGGRIIGYGQVLQDLTEKRKAREDLRRSVMELESFAYTVAHDLRSPLRALQGYSRVLADRLGERADAESRGMLERMSLSAERLDRLIRDLLDYSTIARKDVAVEPVDLDPIVEYVVAHYPELSGVRLRIRSPLGRVLAQPSLLTQILSNLLVNAVKFVPPERVPEIEVWTEPRAGGRLALAVRDNGIGIPRDAWENVFKPFLRLAPGDEGGTGIGLAIVKRAAERMGGAVSLDSEPGRGSRFWVELPEA